MDSLETFVVDSHAWMSYFQKNPLLKELIEENSLKTPSIAVAELATVLRRRREQDKTIKQVLESVLERSTILDLDYAHAVKAGEIAVEEKMHLSDAMIYSYASERERVLTGDKDFAGKPFVKLVK